MSSCGPVLLMSGKKLLDINALCYELTENFEKSSDKYLSRIEWFRRKIIMNQFPKLTDIQNAHKCPHNFVISANLVLLFFFSLIQME